MVSQDLGDEFRSKFLQLEVFGEDLMCCRFAHTALESKLLHCLPFVILKLCLDHPPHLRSPLGKWSTSVLVVLGVAVRISSEAVEPEADLGGAEGVVSPSSLDLLDSVLESLPRTHTS